MIKRLSTALLVLIFLLANKISVLPACGDSKPGGKIVFQSDACGNKEIFIIDADGSNLQRLTNTGADSLYPGWSPDGKSIVFYSNRDGNNEIYMMDADGKNQRRLTRNGASDICPSWHPDGKRIIFTSDRNGTMNFYLMDSNGLDVNKITDFKKDTSDMPRISSDGEDMIFTSNMSLGWQIFIIGMDGKGMKKLTGLPLGHCEGSWSHKGKKLLFVSRLASGNSEISLSDRKGGSRQTLTDDRGLDYNPRFSADDSKILFTSDRDGNWDIYMMDPGGGNTVRLTDTKCREEWPDMY
jgi:TolB protein